MDSPPDKNSCIDYQHSGDITENIHPAETGTDDNSHDTALFKSKQIADMKILSDFKYKSDAAHQERHHLGKVFYKNPD